MTKTLKQTKEHYADNKRISKSLELEKFNIEYSKVYVPLQIIKQILTDNKLKLEAKQIEKTLRLLSHQFHKSNYPHKYKGDKQYE